MGVDLSIGLEHYSPSIPWFLAWDRLGFQRDYELHRQVRDLPDEPVPPELTIDWYADGGIKTRTEDEYGDPLRIVRAGAFHRIPSEGPIQDGACRSWGRWNYAVLRFLRSLPAEQRVVLYWH